MATITRFEDELRCTFQVDHDQVYEMLQIHLDDLSAFVHAGGALLEQGS